MQQQLPLPRNLPRLPLPATTPDPPLTRVGMDSQGRMVVDKGGVVCSAVNKSTRGGGGRWARVEQARRVREAIIVAARRSCGGKDHRCHRHRGHPNPNTTRTGRRPSRQPPIRSGALRLPPPLQPPPNNQDNHAASNVAPRSVSTISIAFSLDLRTVPSTHGDHTVKISCCYNGKLIHTLEGHPRTPWTVKYHPTNSRIVASGCLGFQVRVWDWNYQRECARKTRRMEGEQRW